MCVRKILRILARAENHREVLTKSASICSPSRKLLRPQLNIPEHNSFSESARAAGGWPRGMYVIKKLADVTNHNQY
jgi:hypothetical protein|eukprot:COSAG01_NODE_4422_length_5037_cov_79.147226_3_plen_76_part_00